MKVCVRCQTENSSDYKYCKFCGAELPCVDRKPLWESAEEYPQDTRSADIPVSDDISIYEMNIFVGKNNYRIVPEFIKMQQNNKKAVWCWPVFLLGMFFGFFGMAAWFFYRKMNKIGLILLTAAVLLQAADTAVNFRAMTELYRDSFSALYSYADAFAADPNGAAEWLSGYINELAYVYSANAITFFSFINQNIGGFVLPIIMGLFALYFYKEHSIRKITEIKRTHGGTSPYIMFLGNKGGTSTARAVGALVIASLLITLIASAPMIAFFMGV